MSDTGPNASEEQEQRQKRSHTSSTFVEVSALLAAATIGVYVVGLFALWAPISRTFTNDVSTAWYAVSLIPRTVVAGIGASMLVWPVSFVFLIAFVWTLARIVETFFGNLFKVEQSSVRFTLVCLGLVALGLFVLFVFLWANPTVGPANGQNFERPSFVIGVLTLGTFVCFLSGIASGHYLNRGLEFEDGRYSPKTFNSRDVLYAVVATLLAVFIAACLFSSIFAPPLPKIEFDGPAASNGTLLTHSNGFWYVFYDDGELVAVPDDEAGTVHILPGGERIRR